MSSVDSFMEPKIENYEYTPIRINKIGLSSNGAILQKIFLFVGVNVSDEIKSILHKNANGKKITDKESKMLQNKFGEDYKIDLLIGDDIIVGGNDGDGNDDNDDVYHTISGGKFLEYNDDDDDDNLSFDDDDSESESPSGEYTLFNEKVEPSAVIPANTLTTSVTDTNKITYIFDAILRVNTIEEILLKINYHTGIPLQYINLSYHKQDDTTQNMIYQINYLSTGAEYYTNVIDSFYGMPHENILHGIPVDVYYQKKYTSNQIIIHDLRKMLFADFIESPNELNFVVLNEFVSSVLKKGFYGISDIEQKNIYESFVMKYFPACTFVAFKESLKPPDNSRKIAMKIESINKITENINTIFAINEKDFGEIMPTPVTIATCGIKTNLITKGFTEKMSIFDLRLLFKLFVATKEIPFIVYYDLIEKTKQIKYHNDTATKFPYLIHNWKKIEAKKNKIKTYILFKVLKYSNHDERYTADNLGSSDYMSIHLYSHGATDNWIAWHYTDTISFNMAQVQIKNGYTALTDSINKVDPVAFIGYKTIPYPAVVEYFTIKFKFDLPNGKIASFKDLERHLTSTYPQFYSKSLENESTAQKLYINYIRNSPNNLFITKDQSVNKLLVPFEDTEIDYRTIGIEIDNNYHPRIVILGLIKNYHYFAVLYNFISRTIANYIINVQPKNQKIVEKILIDKKISSSRLRQLQLRDDVLFNFRTNVGENPYSRICQHHKQPNAYTREEFLQLIETTNDPAKKEEYNKILATNESSINVLMYENKTYPGTYLYYTCSDKTYKFPGFQTGSDKHPTHYCLPCCKKMPSVTQKYTSLNNNMKQYLTCIGKGHLIPPENNLLDKSGEFSPKTENYIKIYSKDIGFDRLCHLPIQLAKLFDIRQNYSYLSPTIEAYFIYGTMQGKWAMLNSTLTAVGIIVKYSSEDYFLRMIAAMELPENTMNYDLLANGLVKQMYPTLCEFKKYILETGNIDEYLFCDFLRIAVPLTFRELHGIAFNIVIVADEGELNGKDLGSELIIDFVDKDPISLFRETLSVILLRQNNSSYYPITGHKNNIFTSMFAHDAVIIRKLKEIVSLSKTHTRSTINDGNKQLQNSTEFTIDIIEASNKNIEVVCQIVNEKNMVYEILIKYKKEEFLLPVQMQNLSRRYPVIKNMDKAKNNKKYTYPALETFLDFWDSSDFAHTLDTIIMNEHDEIAGFYNSQGLHFKIIATKNYKLMPKKYTSLKVIHRTSRIMNEDKINESIFENRKSTIDKMQEIIDYKYTNEIYNLFKLEISNYIANEKNETMRKTLTKILQNPDTKIKDIAILRTSYSEISYTDLEILKKIFDRPISKRVLDDAQRYSFDGILRNKLLDLSKDINENKTEIIEILHNVATATVTTETANDKIDFINNSIRNICNNYKNLQYKCENSSQCFWNNKNSTCKLIMNANDYVYFLQMLTDDFIHNEYLRESIIYNTISPVRGFREVTHAEHTIESTPIIDTTDD